jgi:sarcosine oxidase subunit beta
MERTADVVIVGGGVMGTSIAFHLARRRAGRVVLCERRTLASGPTGRSSALLRRHYTLELYARMAARSVEVYKRFVEETGQSAGVVECGLAMAVGPEDEAAMRTTVAMLNRIGVKAEVLTADDLRRVVPAMDPDGLVGAAYEADTGYGEPAGVTGGYAGRARELGVAIHQMTAVTGLVLRGERIAGVETDRGAVSTPTVVNAAGAWGDRIARMAGIELPVTPSRQQLATFELPPGFPRPLPVVVDLANGAYYRPETGDLLMVGSRNPAGAASPADPDRFDEGVDQDRVARAAELICRRFPAMDRGLAVGGYASLYDLTPDLHFLIERSPEVEGLVHAVGFSGHGFKHAPVIGQIVADLVCDGHSREWDITPFSSRRFTDGRPPWRGLYKYWPY